MSIVVAVILSSPTVADTLVPAIVPLIGAPDTCETPNVANPHTDAAASIAARAARAGRVLSFRMIRPSDEEVPPPYELPCAARLSGMHPRGAARANQTAGDWTTLLLQDCREKRGMNARPAAATTIRRVRAKTSTKCRGDGAPAPSRNTLPFH